MNCLEFRRASLSDPRRLDAAAMEHAEQCPACRDFHARGLEAESRLAAVLRVKVPEGLHARVLDRTAAARRPMRWLALAASLLVAVAIAFFAAAPGNDPVALAGIDFVMYEEAQAIADAKPTDFRVLAKVAQAMGVSLSEQLGEIRYVGTCPFAGTTAHHVLVKTPLGKVTLLLVPDRPLRSRVVATAHGMQAAIVPVKAGSVAIIGGSGRSVVRTETLLKSS
jgi:predicted anti-sigma-YlaC factor YlaD